MYEQNTGNNDYFKNNDLRANTIITRLMYCIIIVWIIMALLSHYNILHIPLNDFFLPCLLTVIFDVFLIIFQLFHAPHYFIKYYCLVALEIIIGIASTYPPFNISILYAITPVASCIYFNRELTRRISFFGYIMMMIGLVFRTSRIISSSGTDYTFLQRFLSSSVSYTIEYLALSFVCWAIAAKSRLILEDVLIRKQKIQKMQEQIIFSFANLIESKDNITGQHVKRTSAYVKIIANGLRNSGYYVNELDNASIECICMSAPLHDIGKIKMPDSILLKTTGLNDSEFEFMKTHTIKGNEIIKETMTNLENEQFLHYATNVAMYHHEKWNGTGYPEGLSGQNIPLCARIMAVADVFDALVTARSYKEPMSINQAFAKLEEAKGTHFEPLLVDIFINQKDAVKKIYRSIT